MQQECSTLTRKMLGMADTQEVEKMGTDLYWAIPIFFTRHPELDSGSRT